MHDTASKNTKLIIDTAVELFKKHGYESVSVNDICKAAGVARSSFYLVFSGKKDIIDRLLADVRLHSNDLVNQLISSANDYERMWVLCCRYLDIALKFGPELAGSLLRLELMGELNLLNEIHEVDKWMIKLAKNCKAMGIIRVKEPLEVIVPISVSMVYYVTYEWCKSKGSFSLEQRAREVTESVLDVAEEFRWPKDKPIKTI